MKKHAYLIIAHDNFEILRSQLRLLDDSRNDIYIHIDEKCKFFDFDYFNKLVKKSTVFFIPRIDVKWGDISQVIVELNLLEEATAKNYDYYHLLSGVDLPIKSQDYIHEYFEKNGDTQYIGFVRNHQYEYRVKYYHFFTSRQRFRDMSILNKIKYLINDLLLKVQKFLNIDRTKKYNIEIGKGSQWFSITNDFAQYVVNKKDFILGLCKYSTCSDEIFLQTLLINSPYYKKDYDNYKYDSNLRFIDWERGNPYSFTKEDFDILMSSNALFARKFSMEKDKEIIKKIERKVLSAQ